MRETYDARDVTVTIDGEPLPVSVAAIDYHRKVLETAGALTTQLTPVIVEASTFVSASLDAWREIVEALRWTWNPPPAGASDLTLLRRVSYGGRKGRRALRRLLAKGWRFEAPSTHPAPAADGRA